MPWSGSAGSKSFTRTTGFHTGSTAWQQQEGAGVGLVSVRFDTHDQDIADGINTCLAKDGGNRFTGSALEPSTNDGGALGTTSLKWADLFLASGAVINFDSGDVTITHAANTLTIAGASSGYIFDAVIKPSANDGFALGVSGTAFADLFLASGGVVNWNAGDVTITHSANALAFGGASSGYTFDAVVKASSNDGAALGASGTAWSDMFLASGAVINFAAGDVTITHASNTITVAGGTGYGYDAPVNSDHDTLAGYYARSVDGTSFSGGLFNNSNTTLTVGTITNHPVHFYVNNSAEAVLTAAAFSPASSDGNALGTSSLMWSDLFLASGAVINFNASNYTITHSAGLLTLSHALTVSGAIVGSSTLSIGTSSALTAGTIELGHASENTLSASSGNLSIEGNLLYRAGGTDVPVTDGGTGASTAAGAYAAIGPSTIASFSAHKNGSGQNIATTDATKVTFGTEVFDVGSKFATSTWTPAAGKVLLTARCYFSSVTSGQTIGISIYKGGAELKTADGTAGTGSAAVEINVIDTANGTDTYEVYVASSDSSYTVEGSAALTYFCGSMI